MEVLLTLLCICCLITTEAQQGTLAGIMLDSTLKQTSLCPGDESTTFTCHASGTDLVWRVGERTLSFNYNARMGRSRIDGDYTAILISIDNVEGNGHADRFSVLTVVAQLQATEMLSVKCHNGSDNLAEEIQYLPIPAEPPAMPTIEVTVNNRSRVANISWTAPIINRDLQYYAIRVGDGLPVLTRNTTILYHLSSSNSEHYCSLRAVDQCGQKGLTANITIVTVVDSSPGNEVVPTSNHVKKDCTSCLLLVILLLLVLCS